MQTAQSKRKLKLENISSHIDLETHTKKTKKKHKKT